MIFLIDYDPKTGELKPLVVFDEINRMQAMDARFKLELAYHRKHIKREVVLLEAEDEQAIRKTHRRYFETLGQLATLPENGI